tara:strand:+ start:17139 stop:17969 length:831 start_codon:yes stop_codon:yes gene_type:complete
MTKASHVMEKLADGWGWNILHGALDLAGMVPIVGNVADLANAGIYSARGKYGDAALSAAAAVPLAGYGASAAKGAKWTQKGYKAVKGTDKAAPKVLKQQTKANKVPIKTKVTQNVAETVSKAPLPTQKVIARSNKATSDAAKVLQKVPLAGRAFNPASKIKTWGVDPIVRWRGAENILTAGTQAQIPGLMEADAAYQGAQEGLLRSIGLGTNEPNIQNNNLNKELQEVNENIIKQDNTSMKKTKIEPKNKMSKAQNVMYNKAYDDLDQFLQNNQGK